MKARGTKPIKDTDETNLPRLLERAASEPVLLERGGVVFRLAREDDIFYEPDPELVRRTLAATAGSWSDLDVEPLSRTSTPRERLDHGRPNGPDVFARH